MTELDDLLREQVAYYRARAPEYDQWFLRRGRYDRGPAVNAQWFREVEAVRDAVRSWLPRGAILELAAGTGLWTEHLIRGAGHVTAVDVSREALALNADRVGTRNVVHVCADLFDWRPPRRYDGVFFGFWLSHVPYPRFGSFWRLVHDALKPGGSVFFVDSRFNPASTALDHELERAVQDEPEGESTTTVIRRLNDGREFRIVKIFHRAERLGAHLADLGWRFRIRETGSFFIYGVGEPAAGWSAHQ